MAAKTYSNCVALLWWLTERWVGREPELDRIEHLAERVALIQSNDGQTQRLLEAVDVGQGMALCGHGPHAATARYGAQLLAQWAKVPALDHSIAALRHGFIEMIEPGFSVVVVTTGQRASASRLLKDLHGYGARAIALQAGSAMAAVGEGGREAWSAWDMVVGSGRRRRGEGEGGRGVEVVACAGGDDGRRVRWSGRRDRRRVRPRPRRQDA